MRCAFEIPGKLPSLNDYTRANRAGWQAGASMKRKAEEAIIAALGAGVPHFTAEVDIWMLWIRPDMRTDKDNVCFAKKFIQDALQKAGVIKGDGWKACTPHDYGFLVNKANPRTVVIVQDAWELPPTSGDFPQE